MGRGRIATGHEQSLRRGLPSGQQSSGLKPPGGVTDIDTAAEPWTARPLAWVSPPTVLSRSCLIGRSSLPKRAEPRIHDERASGTRVRPPARPPAWVVVTQVFIGLGWLRAAAEKLIEPHWWAGGTINDFLADHDDTTLGWSWRLAR